MRAILVAVAFVAAACAHDAAEDPIRAATSPEVDDRVAVDMTLTRTVDGAWFVDIETGKPVAALMFARSRGDYRRDTWRPLGAVAVTRRGVRDALEAESPFTRAAFEVTPFSGILQKDYTPFIPYSDGGWSIYPGQFEVYAFDDAAEIDAIPDDLGGVSLPGTRTRYRFVDAQGASFLAFGERTADEIAFEEKDAFVYLGDATPIETEHLAAIADPSLPAWLRESIAAYLPRLFEFYAGSFAYAPPGRPMVLIAPLDTDRNGISLKGGTLKGQIAMQLGGSALTDPDRRDDAERHVRGFLAHEAAHLWNAEGFQPSNTHAWIHEGGAEALAFDATARLDPADGAAFARDRYQSALDACQEALAGGSLATATRRGDFRAHYDCGAIVMLAAATASTDGDVAALWNRLAERARNTEALSPALFMLTLADLGADAGAAAAIDAFLHETHADPAAAARFLFDATGVAYAVNGDGGVELAVDGG